MAPRNPHLRDSTVTVGNTCLSNHGLNLYCLDCNHRAEWSPAELAAIEPPQRLLWDFKRRRKCARCGAKGSTDRVYLTCSVVGIGSGWDRPLKPTLPQLWASWPPVGMPPQMYAG